MKNMILLLVALSGVAFLSACADDQHASSSTYSSSSTMQTDSKDMQHR